MATRVQVTFDCADPDALSHFWAAALGYKLQDPPAGFESWQHFLREHSIPEEEWDKASAIVDPEGMGPRIYFQKVPERKADKNRLHLDLNVGGGWMLPVEERKQRVGAEAERLAGIGATIQGPHQEGDEYWVVMKDPEGNEFCLQ